MATEITQLFIDINNEDGKDLLPWGDNLQNQNSDVTIPIGEFRKRMRRFNGAFSKIFNEKLTFEKVDGLKVIFKKDGKSILIEKLSSGEKQIVFRGGFLLKNKNSLSGATILIDEPELSMHPKWQKEILKFYQSLFKSENNVQTSQIFIATHSDHILKSALEDENCLIVKLTKTGHERISGDLDGKIFETITLAEVKWRIFDLTTTDFYIELYAELGMRLLGSSNNVSNLDEELQKRKAPKIPIDYPVLEDKNDKTLITYIRNYIHHPTSGRQKYSDEEFMNAIKFMIKEIEKLKVKTST